MSRSRLTSWSSVILAVIFTAVIAVASATAATLTSANDYPGTLQVGEAGNHKVVFTTPSGVAAGDTITLTFESDFDTSSITEDDVDISDDGVDLTTAADCSGSEEASVVIAADVVTITICAGDGGDIAATSEVQIEIGTNATSSGTGANQVTNPASAGTYYLSIGGTFGDSGSIALPIGGDDSVAVTATVSQDGGGNEGGGNNPPPQGDQTSPKISNVIVSEITTTSALITWNTDESADSKVDYGLTDAYELGSTTDNSLISAHSIRLTGLSEGTTYLFQVRSSDLTGNEGVSSGYTFTTVDETAPEITDVQVVDITETSARITWVTNESADSAVDYGLTDAYGSSETDAAFVTEHSVLLTGLNHSTEYFFRVTSVDASLNETTSAGSSFTTLINAAPANVTDLTATPGNAQVALSWTNPADEDLAAVLVLACENESPSAPNDPDCTTILDALATSTTHTNLVNARTYYYGVFAYDESGQFASGALVSSTPRGPENELPPEEEDPPPEPPEDDQPPQHGEPGGSGSSCGDGLCSEAETSASCPADCAPEPEGPVCGNNQCEAGEDADSCVNDCPVAPPEETGEVISRENVQFFVAGGTIRLYPPASGPVRMLGGRTLQAKLFVQPDLRISRAQLRFGSAIYNMAPNFQTASNGSFTIAAAGEDAYTANVIVPNTPSHYDVAISVDLEDGTSQTLSFQAAVEGSGYVFSANDGQNERITEATARLLLADGVTAWDGSPYRQLNPITTGTNGTFAWYVPNGSYVVRVSKEGYTPAQLALSVQDSIVNPTLGLVQTEEPPVVPPTEPQEPPSSEPSEATPESPVTPVTATIEAAKNVTKKANEVIKQVRETPGVSEAAEASVPALAATAAASGAVLATSFNLVPFLQYFFTSPLLFFARRKRRGYGVVYNAVTKQPVDLATVRLFRVVTDQAGNKREQLAKSMVTDKGGRYFFLVEPGEYHLKVGKQGYDFPSEFLADKHTDELYLDVYHGETVEVTNNNALITANIPMDPATEAQTPSEIVRKRWIRKLQRVVAVSGIVVAAVVAIIMPSWVTIGMIAVQLAIFLLIKRLATPGKPKSWGIVYDKKTGKPLKNAVARIFEPKYNKLLETQVTDSKGRYSFLLGPEQYYAVFQKPGFQEKEIRPVDYSDKKEASEFGVKVSLEPQTDAL